MAIVATVMFLVSVVLHFLKVDPYIVEGFMLGGLVFLALHFVYPWRGGPVLPPRR